MLDRPKPTALGLLLATLLCEMLGCPGCGRKTGDHVPSSPRAYDIGMTCRELDALMAKIRDGMTEDQVRAVAGRPDEVSYSFELESLPGQKVIAWHYSIGGFVCDVYFVDGKARRGIVPPDYEPVYPRPSDDDLRRLGRYDELDTGMHAFDSGGPENTDTEQGPQEHGAP